MTSISRRLVGHWARHGARFLPFADVASAEVPLSRWLRLSLFQASVGMALVLLVGTLNRVMIVELKVPASLVAFVVALPVLYAPARALIGFRSDTHQSALGWRRVPFIWMGTLVQFGGLAVMPFALLVLGGGGNAQAWPAWVGPAGAALAFLLVGAGLHTVQTAGLALATDLAPPEMQPRVVGLMYVMLLTGTIVSAFAFGSFLSEFTPARLVQVIQAAAIATLVLNTVALWKQEARRPAHTLTAAERANTTRDEGFVAAWRRFCQGPGALRRLAVVGLGTLGFGMQDVLLEPYGGQILGLGVGQTTWLTAALACGGLVGFGLASRVLGRGGDAARWAAAGAAVGVLAFIAVLASAPSRSVLWLAVGAIGVGLGGGLFGHGTLTMTMSSAPPAQRGLALGAWGAVQATAAGIAVALGGFGRDFVDLMVHAHSPGGEPVQPITGYIAVYAVEVLLLVGAALALLPLIRRALPRPPETLGAPAAK